MFAGNDGINAQTHYTGVGLAPGSQAWIAQSDRAGKDNLRPVNAKEVLRKVATIPITTWNWKSQDMSIRHMGPMAQDFHAAFGLGETPKGISAIDADGVTWWQSRDCTNCFVKKIEGSPASNRRPQRWKRSSAGCRRSNQKSNRVRASASPGGKVPSAA